MAGEVDADTSKTKVSTAMSKAILKTTSSSFIKFKVAFTSFCMGKFRDS